MDYLAQLSTSQDVKRIIIEKKGSIAEEILSTGKMLIKNEAPVPLLAVSPNDLAVTFVSGGITLEFTHLVRLKFQIRILLTPESRMSLQR